MKTPNRKFIILILLLTMVGFVKSPAQEIQIANKDSIEIWIKEIIKECDKINNDSLKYKITQKDVYGQSSEGGILAKLTGDKMLRKAILTLYGETGKSVSEYYFLNGELIFLSDKEIRYKSAIYNDKVEIKSQQENKYYFKSKKLLRWVGGDGKIKEGHLYPDKEEEIFDDLKNIY